MCVCCVITVVYHCFDVCCVYACCVSFLLCVSGYVRVYVTFVFGGVSFLLCVCFVCVSFLWCVIVLLCGVGMRVGCHFCGVSSF